MNALVHSSQNNTPPAFLIENDSDKPLAIVPAIAKILPEPLVLTSQNQKKKSYKVIDRLGEGLHGVVLEVLSPSGTSRALKVHLPGKAYLKESVQESRNLQLLKEAPHTLRYKDDFELSGEDLGAVVEKFHIGKKLDGELRHAIVMDLLPCADAYALYIKPVSAGETTHLSYDQVVSIAKQGAEALKFYKSKGMVHRDLKSENMAYDAKKDELFIYDFGFAEEISKLNPNDLVQTREFRAPERILFKEYDESIDMWSLGCILFELYTGTTLIPSRGEDRNAQTTIDHLYLMTQQIGQSLSPQFVQSAHSECRSLFKIENNTTKIKYKPSKEAQKDMDDFANKYAAKYPKLPIWQARIFEATELKKGNPSDAKALIDLIGSMLKYESRITPEEVLEQISKKD